MKKIATSVLIALALCLTQAVQAKVTHLLPRPQKIETRSGDAFALNRTVTITDMTNCILLQEFFEKHGTVANTDGIPVKVTIVDKIDGTYDYELYGYENEAYILDITADAVEITAVTPTGVIRAAQTLAQMAEGYEDNPSLEAVRITDWPAFKLRGYMHDVGRSFITAEELIKQIELFSHFKINTFHWHMTENQAWRFQVMAYPALTSDASMTRFPGKYYTQEQCRQVMAAAKKHGIIVIPEIDMPGHSKAFERAMGFNMQSTQGKTVLKKVIDEVVDVFADAPYIHIGGDEVSTTAEYLNEMIAYVESKGKKAGIWNRINGIAQSDLNASITQMWATSGTLAAGKPNIDCRYNYTNHFDVFADLVGIYKSNIYYRQQGDPEVAGTLSCAWNDRITPTQEDIIIQNNVYANVIASGERAWIGGGEAYIEQGGTTLPNSGMEYEEFADFERRFLFHKANTLKDEPIAYVKQANVRWKITAPFPNNGNMNAEFAPEADGKNATADMKESYTYNGKEYGTGMATGAGIYLRHTWGNNTIPTYYGSTNHDNSTAYAWTYIYSDKEQTVGAQIEFQNYGRSEKDSAPDAGKWDRKGSDIWLNGARIAPPVWDNSGKSIDNEVYLLNENFTARKPVQVTLNKGWNKVFIKLPYVGLGGNPRLNKWMFTFVLTDPEGKNAVEGLVYSPNRYRYEAMEQIVATMSDAKKYIEENTGEEYGQHSTEAAEELSDLIAQIESTIAEEKSEEERLLQLAQLNEAFKALKESPLNQPKISDTSKSYLYTLCTPNRGTRYVTSNGANSEITGSATVTEASKWKFVARNDGKLDIVNAADDTYISPASTNNTALRTQTASPAEGWELKPAATNSLCIIVSGTAQFNQTTSDHGYKVFNWGDGANITDDGCQYRITLIDEADEPELPVSPELPDAVLTLTDTEFNGGFPYRLTAEDAAKVFALGSYTIAIDVTMNSTIDGRGAFVCFADPAQSVTSTATPTSSPYMALGHNSTKLAHLASTKSGDVFTGGNAAIAGGDNTKAVFTVARTDKSSGTLTMYVNGTQHNTFTYPIAGYELPAFCDMHANRPDANIYIGGGMAGNAPYELCDGTIHSVQFFDVALTPEQVAAIKYTDLEKGEETAIEEAKVENTEADIYDLQGRKVSAPSESGIYIIDKKKILIR